MKAFFFRDAQYVLEAAKNIKEKAHWEVDVDVEAFHVRSGAHQMAGGLFMGKTLLYSDLNHVVLRILPKFESEAAQNAILVSSHIDTVFSTYVQSLYFHFVANYLIDLLSNLYSASSVEKAIFIW